MTEELCGNCGHPKSVHNWGMIRKINGKVAQCYRNWEAEGCECEGFIHSNDYNIGREEALAEVEKIIDEEKNPYPTDIFPEITDEGFKEIQLILNKHFLAFPFDRISANLMRRARETMRGDFKQKLKEMRK